MLSSRSPAAEAHNPQLSASLAHTQAPTPVLKSTFTRFIASLIINSLYFVILIYVVSLDIEQLHYSGTGGLLLLRDQFWRLDHIRYVSEDDEYHVRVFNEDNNRNNSYTDDQLNFLYRCCPICSVRWYWLDWCNDLRVALHLHSAQRICQLLIYLVFHRKMADIRYPPSTVQPMFVKVVIS